MPYPQLGPGQERATARVVARGRAEETKGGILRQIIEREAPARIPSRPPAQHRQQAADELSPRVRVGARAHSEDVEILRRLHARAVYAVGIRQGSAEPPIFLVDLSEMRIAPGGGGTLRQARSLLGRVTLVGREALLV